MAVVQCFQAALDRLGVVILGQDDRPCISGVHAGHGIHPLDGSLLLHPLLSGPVAEDEADVSVVGMALVVQLGVDRPLDNRGQVGEEPEAGALHGYLFDPGPVGVVACDVVG